MITLTVLMIVHTIMEGNDCNIPNWLDKIVDFLVKHDDW